MKKPRPTVVEKIQAQQTVLKIAPVDIQNLVVAARLALPKLSGSDLINVSTSIANVEAAFAPPAPAPAAEAPKAEAKAE